MKKFLVFAVAAALFGGILSNTASAERFYQQSVEGSNGAWVVVGDSDDGESTCSLKTGWSDGSSFVAMEQAGKDILWGVNNTDWSFPRSSFNKIYSFQARYLYSDGRQTNRSVDFKIQDNTLLFTQFLPLSHPALIDFYGAIEMVIEMPGRYQNLRLSLRGTRTGSYMVKDCLIAGARLNNTSQKAPKYRLNQKELDELYNKSVRY